MSVITVETAAIKDLKGIVHTLPRPARHRKVGGVLQEQGIKWYRRDEGFVCSDGIFVNRLAATDIAFEAGQVSESALGWELTTLDLW